MRAFSYIGGKGQSVPPSTACYRYLNDTLSRNNLQTDFMHDPTRISFTPFNCLHSFEASSSAYFPLSCISRQLPQSCFCLEHCSEISFGPHSHSFSPPLRAVSTCSGVNSAHFDLVQGTMLDKVVGGIQPDSTLATESTTIMHNALDAMLPSEPVFDITEDNNALSILSNLTNEERATKAFPEGNQQDMEPIQDLLPVNSTNTPTPNHSSGAPSRTRIKCPSCNKTFSRKYDVGRHMQTLHQKRKIPCRNCGHRFRKDKLKRHEELCFKKSLEALRE